MVPPCVAALVAERRELEGELVRAHEGSERARRSLDEESRRARELEARCIEAEGRCDSLDVQLRLAREHWL